MLPVEDKTEIINDGFYLIEAAWEVCSQLGGIYTVLRSKAPAVTERFNDRYCMLGPYDAQFADSEFDEKPLQGIFGKACALLKEQKNIDAKYGRRLITGRPQAVLFNLDSLQHHLASYKYFLWKDHQIETQDDSEVDSVILFGYAVFEYIQVL
ncbi:MAG: hypothetical protein OEZ34_07395, partial [Spirochaetia bacterium]|nr:hypothetical protein [Spirochaetia bacterium]